MLSPIWGISPEKVEMTLRGVTTTIGRDPPVATTNPTFTKLLNERSKFLNSSFNLGDFSQKVEMTTLGGGLPPTKPYLQKFSLLY